MRDPSDGILSEAVPNPKDHGPWEVTNPPFGDEWSLALGTNPKAGNRRVGIRWNAYIGGNTRTGYPNQGKGACWFVLPEPVGNLVLAALKIRD